MGTTGRTASLLAKAYQRTPGGYVAFLDESFELEGDRKTFYLMSAVVTHRDQIEPLRDGLRNLVGGNFWHTTESLLTDDGRQRAIEIAAYLGGENGNEVCIVSCKMPIGDDGGGCGSAGLLSAACRESLRRDSPIGRPGAPDGAGAAGDTA